MKRIIFIVFLITLLGVMVSRLNQEVQAVDPVGTFQLEPGSGEKAIGSTFPVELKFNTNSVPIMTMSFRISFPYSANPPEIQVVDSAGSPISEGGRFFSPNTSLPGASQMLWGFPVNSVQHSGGQVFMDVSVAYVDTQGFVTSTPLTLGTFYLKVNSVPSPNPVILHFDPTYAKMYAKSDSTNILLTPVDGSYTIGSAITPVPECSGGGNGNLNCDSQGLINGEDLGIMISSWSSLGPAPTPIPGRRSADLNGDSKVDEGDLNILLENWRIN